MVLNEEAITHFLNKPIRLVKDDGFVISGRITSVYPDCIEFFTDGRTILISFDRINEIVPLREGSHDY